MAVVRWAEHARDDLREVFDFIARDSPQAAEALVERILRATEKLQRFPESGRTVPEFLDLGYRELLVGSYRIQYRVDSDTVWIATVVHGSRLLNEIP
jgi:addiction module RelE/StbE family toxin